jgi:hypothetical protein
VDRRGFDFYQVPAAGKRQFSHERLQVSVLYSAKAAGFFGFNVTGMHARSNDLMKDPKRR